MKPLTFIPPFILVAFALTACGEEKDKEGLSKACPAAPQATATAPTLPGNFPDVKGIVYTGVKKDGPSTIATGYLPDTIGPAHDAYVQAVDGASGYSVTKEEQDAADAEVNFAGGGTSGQVKMVQTCKDRTTVTITIRPA
ncbi:MAG TPA: hypothetical protein VH108_11715 [Gaiellaceae bacterium]|jgi:hypothetical protein|nr:hypothetical protein [Gaiellaceae bacterium]